MAKENHISLSLGREELYALLSLMGIKSLVGVGDNFLSGLKKTEQEMLLRAGANALRAKGWLKEITNDGKVNAEFDATLLTLVGTCATAQRLLILNYLPANGTPRHWYIHLGEYLTVIHRTTQPGVHELWGSVDAMAVVAEISSLLDLDKLKTSNPTLSTGFSITQKDLEKAIMLLKEGDQEASVTTLETAGLSAEEVNTVIKILTKAKATCTFMMMEAEVRIDMPQTLFSLLIPVDGGLWRLEMENEEKLRYRYVTIMDIKSELNGFVDINSPVKA